MAIITSTFDTLYSPFTQENEQMVQYKIYVATGGIA
jgi:hypothetical protein